jgi:tellurite resistance-related uncharacterized protein
MTDTHRIPDGFVLTRTTDVFDETNAPAGLLKAHRVAAGVWARLVVKTGSLHFVFEDEPDNTVAVTAGGAISIPPSKPHHVELDGLVEFAVEFYRRTDENSAHENSADENRDGQESSGLR